MRNSLFTFAPWLPFPFHHAYWDQKEESLCPSLGSRPTLVQGPSSHVPFSLEQTSTICAFSHLGCHLHKTSQNIPFRLGLPPMDTGVPYCLLMLRNNFNDFAFEHRSCCCATEPGYTGDIGVIEIWLIDWLMFQPLIKLCFEELTQFKSRKTRLWAVKYHRIQVIFVQIYRKTDASYLLRYTASRNPLQWVVKHSTCPILSIVSLVESHCFHSSWSSKLFLGLTMRYLHRWVMSMWSGQIW